MREEKISPSEKNRRIREKLWYEQAGLCYWCRDAMHYETDPDPCNLPWNIATIDHLDDRLCGHRGKPGHGHGESRLVLACRNCNEYRGRLAYRMAWVWGGFSYREAKRDIVDTLVGDIEYDIMEVE